ncbi:hypothetical protein U4E84_17845 [Halorubrum sp. AD140]|uniref:hypothetical protein n=1 Tax=Halorubrum sp. AD140 TaxID=3050073 RepID=UPI002ACCD546|nr:hypothetical protein [Halorubrum sp. AD140]MDZ5813195.1 hypothetical protein [Halorubrum sp. AD140]
MSVEIVDRSLNAEETVLVEFETGPVFRVPGDFTIREVAAHLLTPERSEELANILEEIHEAGNQKAEHGTPPVIQVFANGSKIGLNHKLPDTEKVVINFSNS